MKKSHFALLLAVTTFLTAVLLVVAHLNDASGQRSLSILTPLASFASDSGLYLIQNMRQFLVWAVLATAGVLALCMVQRRSFSVVLFLIGALLAFVTQFLLIDETARLSIVGLLGLIERPNASLHVAIGVGVLGYLVATCLVLIAWRSPHAPRLEELQASASKYGWLDFLILVLIVLVGAIFRTYALNQNFNSFEGELAAYSAGATSLSGMFYANQGQNGPWAPLGLLYYIPIYITTAAFGVDLLALRASSALVGILTIPLVFLLANKVAGRGAGLFAAALFSLNCLHIGWSRTDIHPHGVTTWPTLLMCFFLLKAAETKKLAWALATACMMGLSWHQYPSGQSAVIIPLIAVGVFFVFNRGALPLHKSQIALIVLGVGLWFIGLPLSYYPATGQTKLLNPFTLTGPRALWGSDGVTLSTYQMAWFVIAKAAKHFWDFAQGVFFKVPYLFHQEWLPAISPLSQRSVPWFVVSLSMTAAGVLFAQRKRFESAVLFAWFVAAVLPGVLSEHAYPKRMSTTYPLLDILAGVGFSFILAYTTRFSLRLSRLATVALSVLALTAYSLYSAFFWFSGRFFQYGTPPEIAMARELEREITPRTFVITNFGGGYENGKFLYLMLDHLAAPKNRPNLYLMTSNESFLHFFSKPIFPREFVSRTMPYLWTKMRDQVEETVSQPSWERVTFMMVETFHNKPVHAEAIQLASSACPNPTIRKIGSATNSPSWVMISFVVITCPVSEMSKRFEIG